MNSKSSHCRIFINLSSFSSPSFSLLLLSGDAFVDKNRGRKDLEFPYEKVNYKHGFPFRILQ